MNTSLRERYYATGICLQHHRQPYLQLPSSMINRSYLLPEPGRDALLRSCHKHRTISENAAEIFADFRQSQNSCAGRAVDPAVSRAHSLPSLFAEADGDGISNLAVAVRYGLGYAGRLTTSGKAAHWAQLQFSAPAVAYTSAKNINASTSRPLRCCMKNTQLVLSISSRQIAVLLISLAIMKVP